MKKAAADLIEAAVYPLASNPELRLKIVDFRRSYEQIIDETSMDKVLARWLLRRDRARQTVDDFRQFIEDNKDEITALQILYSHPYSQRLSFKDIQVTSRTPSGDRRTNGRLRVSGLPTRRSTSQRCTALASASLTDLVSLVRFALGEENELVPFPEKVNERFAAWLLQQENAGRSSQTSSDAGWKRSGTTSPPR